jgi:outer membrane protein assembly factor BamB
VLNMALPAGQKVTAYVTFRGGQGGVEHVFGETGLISPVVWNMGGPVSLWDVSGVRLEGQQLSGALRYSATPKGPDTISLPVAATVGPDGAVSGKIGEQPVTGTLLSAEQLAKANAFGPGKDWPQYEGPTFNLRGPDTDRPLRENVTQPRLVWMSEERFGAGREHRMDALHGWSGTWSPVMGEGKIFYMVHEGSAGSPVDQAEKKRLEDEGQKAAAAIRLDLDEWGRNLPARITQLASIQADDLAVALDAATGRTLWRTRLPKRSFNCASYNKHADHGRIGAYADGQVYLMGREGRVYCLEAASGKLVWEQPGWLSKLKADALTAGKQPPAQNYPVLHVAGDAVLVGGAALDRRTGNKLWSRPGVGGAVQLEGKAYAVMADGFPNMNVALVEPASGKELWKATVNGGVVVGTVTATLRQVGDLVIAGAYDRKSQVSVSTAYRVKVSGLEKLWEVKQEDGMFLGGMYNSTLADGKVILRYQNDASGLIAQRLLAVNAGTGAIEQKVDFKGVFIGQVSAMNDLVFVWPDGCHTSSATDIYTAKDLKLLGTWNPPHVQTSAYDHPQLVLYVDGRAIVRGRNRMFCYDFRQ